ncbi:MAG: hypothetical protein F4171_02190 [Gammaproteobacteria bacterium]|nr:hypothetical protein [Gammaproteobacteria bacterium]
MLTALQRGTYQVQCLTLAADQLDDNVDFRLVQGPKIGAEGSASEIHARLWRAARHLHEL